MTNGLIIPLVAVGYIIYVTIVKPRLKIGERLRMVKERNKHRIEDITKNGCTIYVDNIPKNITWRSIKSIEFVEEETLHLTLSSDEIIEVLPGCVGRLEFLRKIPEGISKFDYESVEKFFNELQSCKVCGFFALENGDCLNCEYTTEYEKGVRGDKSLEEFYKEEQLDYFTTSFDNNDTVEKIVSDAKKSEIFKQDINWKIYPTNDEIAKEKQKMK
jgi:hypothetical protein